MRIGIRGCWTGRGSRCASLSSVVAALEGRPLLAHQQADQVDRLLEPVDPFRPGREIDPVATMLVLVPARPDPKGQPSAADVVDRDGFLEQECRVPERVAGHEDAEPDPLGPRRDGGQQGPALQAAILGRTVGVDEVVDQPGVVEAERLGEDEVVEHLRPRPARLAQEQPEAQRRVWPPSGHLGSTGRAHNRCSRLR